MRPARALCCKVSFRKELGYIKHEANSQEPWNFLHQLHPCYFTQPVDGCAGYIYYVLRYLEMLDYGYCIQHGLL